MLNLKGMDFKAPASLGQKKNWLEQEK